MNLELSPSTGSCKVTMNSYPKILLPAELERLGSFKIGVVVAQINEQLRHYLWPLSLKVFTRTLNPSMVSDLQVVFVTSTCSYSASRRVFRDQWPAHDPAYSAIKLRFVVRVDCLDLPASRASI